LVTFSQLKRLEMSVIDAINTLGEFGQLTSLRSAANQVKIDRHSMMPIDVNLSFTLPTRIREVSRCEVIDRGFHVGCIAVPVKGKDEISHLSYSVLICQEPFPSTRVARKFHFDFESVSLRNQSNPKPTYHLQLCGELSQDHERVGFKEEDIEHLIPSWSQPRVPSMPMSLVLVLNWLFIEFGGQPSVKAIRTNPRWRSLVREAERSILGPYFKECCSFLNSTAKNGQSFFGDHLYEDFN